MTSIKNDPPILPLIDRQSLPKPKVKGELAYNGRTYSVQVLETSNPIALREHESLIAFTDRIKMLLDAKKS